jgi:hypothetical protein
MAQKYNTREAKLEYMIEKMIDDLDRRLLNDELTEEEYDRKIARVDSWASRKYEEMDRNDKFKPEWDE